MNEEKNYATKIWDPGENINLCFNFKEKGLYLNG